MATLFDKIPQLVDEVEQLIAHYRDSEKLGWNTKTVTDLIGRFVASVTRLLYQPGVMAHCPTIASSFSPNTTPGQALAHESCIERETVLAAFDKFYDTVLAPLDIPFIPDIIELTYVDPAVRRVLRDQASGLFDLAVSLLNRFIPVVGTAPYGAVMAF